MTAYICIEARLTSPFPKKSTCFTHPAGKIL